MILFTAATACSNAAATGNRSDSAESAHTTTAESKRVARVGAIFATTRRASRSGLRSGQIRATLTLQLEADRIRVPMRKRFFSWGWLALVAPFSCLTGCNKPQPNAPSQDFARRHQCPATRIQSSKEGLDRMRVTGCGESDLYVRSCENRGGASPPFESHQPVTEGEAHNSLPHPPPSEQGCAWAREQKTAPPAGSASQPKWLSSP